MTFHQLVPRITSREDPRGHRQVILDILAVGPIVDRTGRAVEKLAAETGHFDTNPLSKILRRMETDGQITREVRGRRTFRIDRVTANEPGILPGHDDTRRQGMHHRICISAIRGWQDFAWERSVSLTALLDALGHHIEEIDVPPHVIEAARAIDWDRRRPRR